MTRYIKGGNLCILGQKPRRKTKMENTKKQRVVLNLTLAQAQGLENFLRDYNEVPQRTEIKKLHERLTKTINKRLNEKMQPMLGAIVEAAQGVIDQKEAKVHTDFESAVKESLEEGK